MYKYSYTHSDRNDSAPGAREQHTRAPVGAAYYPWNCSCYAQNVLVLIVCAPRMDRAPNWTLIWACKRVSECACVCVCVCWCARTTRKTSAPMYTGFNSIFCPAIFIYNTTVGIMRSFQRTEDCRIFSYVICDLLMRQAAHNMIARAHWHMNCSGPNSCFFFCLS